MRMFKNGTYFTGINRECYPRSLYEYIGYKRQTDKHTVRHLFLDGFASKNEYSTFEVESKWFNMHDYRKATNEEVNKYFETKRCEDASFYKRTG